MAPQSRFNIASSLNEPIALALAELAKFEHYVFLRGSNGGGGEGGTSDDNNPDEIKYCHAAASVRACRFAITPRHSTADLARMLPWVHTSMAAVIAELAASSAHQQRQGGTATAATCRRLSEFRADLPVCRSNGAQRQGTAGARTRRMLCGLPGIGPAYADK